jgi:hypothetical protein
VRATAIRRADTYHAPGTLFEGSPAINEGDRLWQCTSYGVVYPSAIVPEVILELFFPERWGLAPAP